MKKRIDLFSKIRGILEYEAGLKTYAKIGAENGVTKQAVIHWVKNKQILFQEVQSYGTIGLERMIMDLSVAETAEQMEEDPTVKPEQKTEGSDAAIIKSLQEENNFLKNKLLYFEKLMESYGIDASKVRKKKDIRPSEAASKQEPEA